jgi:hypothetical protein
MNADSWIEVSDLYDIVHTTVRDYYYMLETGEFDRTSISYAQE